MPELPEVETVCRGLSPRLLGRTIVEIRVRRGDLRHEVDGQGLNQGCGQRIASVGRRGKYVLLSLTGGGVVIHLGMSGVLRWLPDCPPPGLHDHVDMVLDDAACLRFHDPRRFGAVLWWPGDPVQHPVLAGLGPEPLSPSCTADYFLERAAGRRLALRLFLMDGRVVAGIGNIYAAEICFVAGLHPGQPVRRLALADWQRVVAALRQVLTTAIRQGGTTLKDYRDSDGRPGYFQQQLQVYGRTDAPCPRCAAPIQRLKQGGRSAFFCPGCQVPLPE